MLRCDTVIFDLDGTLLDTLDDLMDATNHALAQLGYPARTRKEVESPGPLISSSPITLSTVRIRPRPTPAFWRP